MKNENIKIILTFVIIVIGVFIYRDFSLTEITLTINTIALSIVIYETYLTKKSLDITKKSIDSSRIQRQLESLPEYFSIIEAQTLLKKWISDLEKKRDIIEKSLKEDNYKLIKELSEKAIEKPEDLSLNRYIYKDTPVWLKEIIKSAAQHYYNSAGSVKYIDKNISSKYSLAENSLIRIKESLKSLKELLSYIDNMVPEVILNTPASLSIKRFFKES